QTQRPQATLEFFARVLSLRGCDRDPRVIARRQGLREQRCEHDAEHGDRSETEISHQTLAFCVNTLSASENMSSRIIRQAVAKVRIMRSRLIRSHVASGDIGERKNGQTRLPSPAI